MSHIEEFIALCSRQHPKQVPQPVKRPRKRRVFPLGKYGCRQDSPDYYRNRYAMNADYQKYCKDYWDDKRANDPVWVESYREHCRNYAGNNVLGTTLNGKQVRILVKKRPWPGHCELCEKKDRKLFYHHWDDENMSLGLWLCLRCHMFAENADIKGITEKYIELKKQVTSSLV